VGVLNADLDSWLCIEIEVGDEKDPGIACNCHKDKRAVLSQRGRM